MGPDKVGVEIELLIMYGLLVINLPLSFCVDLMVYLHGDDLTKCMNWLNKITESFDKGRGRKLDLIGLIANQMVSSYTYIMAAGIPLFLVYGDWEPVYLGLIMLAKSERVGASWMETLAKDSHFKLARYIIMIVGCQPLTINLRTISVVLLLQMYNLTRHMKFLSKKVLSIGLVRKYKETWTGLKIVEAFMRNMLASYLTIVFFILVVGTNVVILGLRHANFGVLSVSLFAIGMNWIIVIFTLESTCALSELSEIMIVNWNRQLKKISTDNRAYTKKLIKSCRQIAFKIGSLCRVTREMKMGYFDSVLTQLVNLLVVCNDLL